MLQRDFSGSDFLDPAVLRNLANLARVSPASVVVRLGNLARFPMPYGMIVCVERSNEGLMVQTMARHEGFRDVFLDVVRGALIQSLLRDSHFIFCGGKSLTCEAEQTVAGKRRKYKVKTEDSASDPRHSYFLTITRISD
jgi:hypothetical protein